jgi:hypothetical protein
MSDSRSSLQPAVFVIAPTDVSVHVRSTGAPVLRFSTSAEFAQWRHQASTRITAAVYAALAELEIDPAHCSPRTQEVLAHLCERETIPSVKELFAACSSRRSFYRSWTDDVCETPAAFLIRVRLRHLHSNASRDGNNDAAQRGTSGDSRNMR